ncbi:MAG: putative toxin-antitoxin system toxin component, PIN family [Phycisphaeraceae bacterium]
MRLVLDTNTVVSGLLWNKTPAQLIDAGLEGRIELFTSEALVLELEDVLPRHKLARRVAASGLSIAQLVARYALLAQSVTPAIIGRVSKDPDDDHVLACAIAAQADLIVSGDPDLLNLKSHQDIPIVNAAEALTRLPQR